MAIRNIRPQSIFDGFDITGGRSPYQNIEFGSPSSSSVSRQRTPFQDIDFGGSSSTSRFSGIPELGIDAPTLDTGKQEPDFMTLLNQMYTPETRESERFSRLLDQYPQREEPGWGRKLVAGGLALGNKSRGIPGGIDVAEKAMYAPYYRDVGEWKEKTGPFYNAAQLERQSNVNERTLASGVLQNQFNLRKLEETERSNKAKEENQRIRAEAYSFKQRHPDWKFDTRGPTIKAFNPANPREIVDLGPSGKLSDADRIDLEGEWGVKKAEASGAAAVERAQAAGAQIFIGDDGQAYTVNPRTPTQPAQPVSGIRGGVTRPGTERTNETTPGEVEKNIVNRARELKIRRADIGDMITIGTGGNVTVRPPKTNWMGKYDPGEVYRWQEANRYIYGKEGVLPPENPWGPNAPEQAPVQPRGSFGVPGLGGWGGQNIPPNQVGIRKSSPEATAAAATIQQPPPSYGIRPGSTAVRNLQTGEIGWITNDKVAAALKSGRFTRAQ